MIRAVQLYTFLEHCKNSPLNKDILECGAGVWDPSLEPLFVRFSKHGFKVHGIEISDERAAAAWFLKKREDIWTPWVPEEIAQKVKESL